MDSQRIDKLSIIKSFFYLSKYFNSPPAGGYITKWKLEAKMFFIPALEFTHSMVTAAREKLASLTPVKLNGDPLILKEFATLLAIRQMSKMLLDAIYSYQNIQISISEWVKSNRDSLGLNQEAACNTLNSREIIRWRGLWGAQRRSLKYNLKSRKFSNLPEAYPEA
ncbi:hypothetical protein T06_12146 [Trichinella sp. T6]|nr:hypothetical protein T06_12146 [Trichinella sp. T6]